MNKQAFITSATFCLACSSTENSEATTWLLIILWLVYKPGFGQALQERL